MVDIVPTDQAGNTFETARNITVGATQQSWTDWVGNTDILDNYKFTLESTSALSARLDGLSADAELQLFNASGQVLAHNSQTGTQPETITMPALAAGTYYLRVTGGYTGTNYNLTASATPVIVDNTPPTVSTFSPADEATGVAVGSNIVVTFSEPIQRGTGNIVLKTTSGTTVATYNAATSSNLTLSGNTLTIDPSSDLAYNTGYKIEFASGSIKDLAGNGYTGTTSYNFTTANQTLKTINDDLLVAAVNLAARAYQDEHYAANGQSVRDINDAVSGWQPIDKVSLGYDSGDTRLNPYADGHLLRFDNVNASATVGLAVLNGKRTLGISFEGTNFPVDDERLDLWEDIVDLDDHAAKLSDFMQRVYTHAHPHNSHAIT